MLTADKILGNMIDVINVIVKGIVMYFLTMMFDFWGYQDGSGKFSPFRCMLIFICAFEVLLVQKYMERFKKNKHNTMLLPVCICIGINFLMSRCIGAGKNAFFIISIFPFAENVIIRYKLRNQTEFIHTMRNVNCGLSRKYGIVLCLIAIFTIIESDYPSVEYPISADSCTTHFYVWFVIYLSLVVLLKYVKMQYTESRKYYGRNIDFLKKQLKTDVIMLLFSLIIFLPIVFIVQNTIFVPLCMLIIRIFMGMFNAGISVISENVMENLIGLFSMTDRAQMVESEGARIVMNSGSDFNPIMLIITIGAVVFAVAFIISLLKLYKIKCVCYKSEEEEASFVEEEELKNFEVQEIITVKYNFPHNNNGIIRKYYYKYMNNKIKKSRLKEALCSTPTELEDKFTDHDDKEAVRKLTEKYEIVRYSKEGADVNEVYEAKNIYRKLMKR